jgi:hypothetical protein
MSSSFRDLERHRQITVPIPKDENGFYGRECPEAECLGYFKLKPGTGLKGTGLPCHCPYCGYEGPSNRFWTKEQLEYGKSQALRQVHDALRRGMKEIFSQPVSGGRSGVTFTFKEGRQRPIRYYREKALETHVTCGTCTLEYAIYGVFAFCPDCGTHNSQQILERNLNLVAKQVALAGQVDDADFRRHLLEDALENCVSSLDGFGRETCRVRTAQSTAPDKCENLSFQNLPKAAKRVTDLFGVDLLAAIDPKVWERAHRGFMKRHVVAHRASVVDHQYIDETGDVTAIVGRKIPLDPGEVSGVALATLEIGAALVRLLPPPVTK